MPPGKIHGPWIFEDTNSQFRFQRGQKQGQPYPEPNLFCAAPLFLRWGKVLFLFAIGVESLLQRCLL